MITPQEVYVALGRERAELQSLARLDREDRLLADRVKVLKRELRWQDDPSTPFSRAWALKASRLLPLAPAAGLAWIVAGAVVLALSGRLGLLAVGVLGVALSLMAIHWASRRGGE